VPLLAAPIVSGFVGGLAGPSIPATPASVAGTLAGIVVAGVASEGTYSPASLLGGAVIIGTLVVAGHLTAVAVRPTRRVVS
jgi:hypothetical protein